MARGRKSLDQINLEQRESGDSAESFVWRKTVSNNMKTKHPLLLKYSVVDPPRKIPRTTAFFKGLFESQIQVLEKISRTKKGAAVSLSLGGGKFLISMLAPIIKKSKNTLLIVPPKLYDQTVAYRMDWIQLIPEISTVNLSVISTGEMSSAKFSDFLDSNDFDMIIIDECQDFRNKKSARAKRLKRYLDEKKPILLLLTATFFTRSFSDLWLTKYVSEEPTIPSSLLYVDIFDSIISKKVSRFPVPESELINELHDWHETITGEKLHGYRKEKNASILMERIRTYPDIFIDSEDSCATECWTEWIYPTVSPLISEQIRQVMESWVAPGGSPIIDALEYHRIGDYVSLGFTRNFKILNEERYIEYENARRDWSWVLKGYLNGENKFLDSMLLVKQRVKRDGTDVEKKILAKWEAISKEKVREPEYIWSDKTIISKALENLEPGTLIWYVSLEVERELENLGYRIRQSSTEKIPETHALSFLKFHAGANFQDLHCRNLFLQVPVGRASLIDQAIGRTHRAGQEKNVISKFLCAGEYHEVKYRKLQEDSERVSTFQGTPTKFSRILN